MYYLTKTEKYIFHHDKTASDPRTFRREAYRDIDIPVYKKYSYIHPYVAFPLKSSCTNLSFYSPRNHTINNVFLKHKI